jgi:hypothetical protein
MRKIFYLCTLIFISQGQTRIDLGKQVSGSNFVANHYFHSAHDPKTGKLQIFPGNYFNDFVVRKNVTPPTNSNARCGLKVGETANFAFEFSAIGDIVLTNDFLYICIPTKTWRRIRLETF